MPENVQKRRERKEPYSQSRFGERERERDIEREKKRERADKNRCTPLNLARDET